MIETGKITPPEVWALVPVKAPIWAKTRLAGLLTEAERARLQWAMLQDVLDQLRAARWLTGIAITSPDAGIQALAISLGHKIFGDEPPNGGLNGAVAHGVGRLRATGADLIAVLPGDVPTLDAADIDRAILCAIQENTTVVVPDQRLEGTNALVFRAACPPRFQFGTDSFSRHMQEPGQSAVKALPLASIARDIDWPDDLDALRQGRSPGTAPNTSLALAGCAYQIAQNVAEENR